MKQLDEVQQYKTFVTVELMSLLDYVAPDFLKERIQKIIDECYDVLPDPITFSFREN